MPKISFIIVNYSTKTLLEQCINNLLNVTLDHEIIVVDNNSPDGSADHIKKVFSDNKRVHLIKNQNNGLACGYNIGIKSAKGDVHIFLGTDAFPTSSAIDQIYEYMLNNPSVGAVSPHLYTRDGKSDLDAHRGLITPWVAFTHFSGLEKLFKNNPKFNGYDLSYLNLNTTHQIDAGISHFLAINPNVYKKVGYWDEKFFLFGEDIDFCYRIKQAGFKIMYLGEVKVLHYKGATISRKTAQDIQNAVNMQFENNLDQNSKTLPNTANGYQDQDQDQDQSQTVLTKKIVNKPLKIMIAKESTKSMRYFYKKHFSKKYNPIITNIVIISTYLIEFLRVIKIKLS